MKIVLCFASYQVVSGMYFNTSFELGVDSLEDTKKKVNEYYRSLGIEEYLLADTWSDDSDTLNKLIGKNYSECWYSFYKFLEELEENEELFDISEEIIEACIFNYGSGLSISELIEKGEGCTVYEDIDEYFLETLEGLDDDTIKRLTSLFAWLDGESVRCDYMTAQGHDFVRLDGGVIVSF